MSRVAGNSLLYFFVHDHIDLNTTLRGTFDDLVKAPFLVEEGWSAQEEFGGEPPILNVDGLLGMLEADRNSIKVVTTIDVPLDLVVLTLWEVRLEAMRLTCRSPLAVGFLFVLLVVTVISVDQILELAEFMLEVDGLDFGICEVSVNCSNLPVEGLTFKLRS